MAERELSGEKKPFTTYVKGQLIAETRFAAGAWSAIFAKEAVAVDALQ